MIQFPRFYLKNENGQILFDVDTYLSAVIYETVNVMKMIFSGLLNIAANIMIHAVIPLSDIYGYITAVRVSLVSLGLEILTVSVPHLTSLTHIIEQNI